MTHKILYSTQFPFLAIGSTGGTTLKTVTLTSYGFFVSLPMHYLYILYSKILDRYYVGETPNTEIRLMQHSNHYFPKSYTKSAEDWEMVFSRECADRKDASYLERFIKRMKSKKFIQRIIQEPQILDDILSKKQ